jgi:hypothetical protein
MRSVAQLASAGLLFSRQNPVRPTARQPVKSVIKNKRCRVDYKDWMGRGHFLTRKLANVATEMSLHVLAYNLKRAVAVLGTSVLMAAIRG